MTDPRWRQLTARLTPAQARAAAASRGTRPGEAARCVAALARSGRSVQRSSLPVQLPRLPPCRRASLPRRADDRPPLSPRARSPIAGCRSSRAGVGSIGRGGGPRGAHWPQPADARGGARAASRPTGDDARGARGYARVASGETETRARLRLLDSTLRLRSAELHPALQPPFS